MYELQRDVISTFRGISKYIIIDSQYSICFLRIKLLVLSYKNLYHGR